MRNLKKIKFMPDYGCWPLWDVKNLGDISPYDLSISEQLTKDIVAWAEQYDMTLNEDDPVSSGFNSVHEEYIFVERGRLLMHQLKLELPDCDIFEYGYLFAKYPTS